MPDVLPGVGIEGHDGTQKQIVALALAAQIVIPGVAVADAHVEESEFRVVVFLEFS